MAAVSTVLVSLTQCPHEDLPQAQSSDATSVAGLTLPAQTQLVQ